MQKAFQSLLKSGEKDNENYVSFVIHANFGAEKHNMVLEEENFRKFYNSDYLKLSDEFSLLEKIDLTDFWKCEYGRTNKKR
jgi:hypothetical protein